MQDSYIGDIGDYGKYGLLREIYAAGLTLSVNWYKVVPRKQGKQDDGKFTDYLSSLRIYRGYDPVLFDALYKIVCEENNRQIERIEAEQLFPAAYVSDVIGADRSKWHREALELAKGRDVVFLDPDNGLETANMNRANGATEKHVKWSELRDYYARGQNVILYQHRPQMTKKEQCIQAVMSFQKEFLGADCVKLLEFPKYTNRFYFMFIHKPYEAVFQEICTLMAHKWGENHFCREIILE